jgi:hypothetical protein
MNPELIIKRTCAAFKITPEDLRSSKRGKISQARAIISWGLVNKAGLSLHQAAHWISGRHDTHSCVYGGIKRVNRGDLDRCAQDLGYETGIALAEAMAGESEVKNGKYDRYLRRIMVSDELLRQSGVPA